MTRVALAAFGWLVPGGTYLLMRRYAQFAVFAVLVCAAFAGGLALQGGCLWPTPGELGGIDSLSRFMFRAGAFARVLAGGPYVAACLSGVAGPFVDSRLHEYGSTLMGMAGMLNLLAISDAMDVRKRLAR